MTDFFFGAAVGAIGAAVIFDWWWFGWTLSSGRCLHCGGDPSTALDGGPQP